MSDLTLFPHRTRQNRFVDSCLEGAEVVACLGELIADAAANAAEADAPFGNFSFPVHYAGWTGLRVTCDRGQVFIDVQGMHGGDPDRWYALETVLIAAGYLTEREYLDMPSPPDPGAFAPCNAWRRRMLEAHFDVINAYVNQPFFIDRIQAVERRFEEANRKEFAGDA